jgi:glycosyltransferase involved in cell wall biosynthesis
MVPYKRADVAIRAFKELDLPLKVVGTGRDMEALKGLAGPKTEFLGFVPDEGVRELFTQCRAFIQVGAEDFGITPVEAMAGGAPVIAINQYGPAEIVIDGENGLFFDQQTPEALIEAVKRFENDPGRFNSDEIRRYAETFDRKLFCQRFGDYVNQRWEEHQGKNGAEREPLNV